MSLPSKNYNLVFATAIAVSTALVAAVANADPNPYLVADTTSAPSTDKTIKTSPAVGPATSINKQKLSNPGALQQKGSEPYVKEGPIFVKDGGKLQGAEKIRTVPGKLQQTGKDAFVKEGPIFVKDGGKLPGADKIKTSPQLNKSDLKSQPSAVEIEKQIRTNEN